MKKDLKLLLLFCSMGIAAYGQKNKPSKFDIGDPAPSVRVGQWLKGTPVKSFKKGQLYVVEFWATWCKPCMAAMPHLSTIARKYKNDLTVIALDVYEEKTPTKQVQALVDKMGDRMDFNVATEDTQFTVADWLEGSDEKSNGIPKTFVIDRQGKVAWIGEPNELDNVLAQIMDNSWDMKQALSRKKFNKYLQKLDSEVFDKLHRYAGKYDDLNDRGKPDSALMVINEIVKKEPKLKYAPAMASFTFSALLRTNPEMAYEFGKQVMVTYTYDSPACNMIIGAIKDDSRKLKLPPDIYRLGAECYQAEIDRAPYPELIDTAKQYSKIAAWYRLAGDELKATNAEQKATNVFANAPRLAGN